MIIREKYQIVMNRQTLDIIHRSKVNIGRVDTDQWNESMILSLPCDLSFGSRLSRRISLLQMNLDISQKNKFCSDIYTLAAISVVIYHWDEDFWLMFHSLKLYFAWILCWENQLIVITGGWTGGVTFFHPLWGWIPHTYGAGRTSLSTVLLLSTKMEH